MPNAKDDTTPAYRRILLVGPTGSGKSSQIWTLPGRKFAYIFDPNSLATLYGCDLEYERFVPDVLELDATLKGFNVNPLTKQTYVGDTPKRKKPPEPRVWNAWGDHLNRSYEEGLFKRFDWLCFDSMTFVTKSGMDRQLFINNRYGEVEDRPDYKIVGSKITDVFSTINTMDINILCTGHIDTFKDEDTQRTVTEIMLPGRARKMLPLQFTDIWETTASVNDKGEAQYHIRTVPQAKGLQVIRCSIPNLSPTVDVTIAGAKGPLQEVKDPTSFGIGKILKGLTRPKLQVVS